jgi:hypothetical protein
MTILYRDKGNANLKIRITFIRNESSKLLTPSYQIRLKPLIGFLQKRAYSVNEVTLVDFLRDPSFSDVIVFQRYISEDSKNNKHFLSMALHELRSNCEILIWDLDDDLYELASRHDDDPETVMLQKFRDDADILTVSTQRLQEKEFYSQKAFLLPNHPLKEMKKTRYLHRKHAIKVGYLGNFDRGSDLLTLLAILADKYPSQKICIYSYGVPLRFSVRVKTLSKFFEIHSYPTMDYESILNHYSRLRLHFSIAPLSDTVFNQSKSAIKFIDYSVNSAPILISRVGEISDILPLFDFLPPIDTEMKNAEWIDNLDLILKRDRSFAQVENLARSEFRKVRNLDSQECNFEALMDLVTVKNFKN